MGTMSVAASWAVMGFVVGMAVAVGWLIRELSVWLDRRPHDPVLDDLRSRVKR